MTLRFVEYSTLTVTIEDIDSYSSVHYTNLYPPLLHGNSGWDNPMHVNPCEEADSYYELKYSRPLYALDIFASLLKKMVTWRNRKFVMMLGMRSPVIIYANDIVFLNWSTL